ncbi:hypothetical protein GCM10009841_20020 [Microlunatus panaciterrae]|uniref:Uncharacterized protein n=1 Tax=Microlunatus panaciterrae TaxID=400768 RepID=A0ABS2RNG2_9ACTN|nr:DUF6326 family protein [Microlunatus panaciterrae]MBM7800556.1 hypothetical protein [Microlunatus panaciterrae]
MNADRISSRDDPKVNVKVVLSGLWVSMLFVFAYVDIFGFWRADVIYGALHGRVPGGVEISQVFLTLTTLYILVPSIMVTFSLMAPARINRPINVIVSLLYAVSVVAAVIGETWAYYVIGSVVEVLLLLTIAAAAWFWHSSPTRIDAAEPTEPAHIEPADLPKSRQ